jgi:carboxypeptidase Q
MLLSISAIVMAAQDNVDRSVLSHIKQEAFQNSQVMDDLFYLTDVYGPRLTNSPGHKQAAEWVMQRLRDYGLENVHEEAWGPFGRSWRLTYFSAHLLEPQYQSLIGLPLAWTPGPAGDIKVVPVMAVIASEADFDRFKGKLKDKVVLSMEPKVVTMSSEPLARRFTDDELIAREKVLDPSHPFGGMAAPNAPPPPTAEQRAATAAFHKKVAQFYVVVRKYSTAIYNATLLGKFQLVPPGDDPSNAILSIDGS